ncbi:MAG: hypothetical protein LBF19_06370 [Prevotellaceae bacterium]|jgi:hypothetical protein|nr:hypothetical protein [Prevotellaceae bacterium]
MKPLTLLKNVFVACTLLATLFACSKDDEDNGLIGRWNYREANMRFSINGEWHDGKEEGLDLSDFNNNFRGLFFIFEGNGTLLAGMGGQSDPMGSYNVSSDKITINDGSSTFAMGYRIAGKTLDLIWYRSTFHALGISTADIDDMGFDDFEIILIFDKAN